jgi:hypothetical protein
MTACLWPGVVEGHDGAEGMLVERGEEAEETGTVGVCTTELLLLLRTTSVWTVI